MRCHILLPIVLLGLSLGSAVNAAGQVAPPKSAGSTVPLNVLQSGHIALSAKLNGKGPFGFILDTGSPITFVDVDTALEAGLIKGVKPTTQPSLFPVSMTSAGTIRVGNVETTNVSVMVLNHPVISLLSQIEGPLHGILGFSFWARFNMVIDYADGTITLTAGSFRPPDAIAGVMSRLFGGSSINHLVPAAQWGLRVAKPAKQKRGVTVTAVYSGTPASSAGIQPGDILLSVDGRWTDSLNDCWSALSKEKPGEPVPVTILRGIQRLHLSITPVSGL